MTGRQVGFELAEAAMGKKLAELFEQAQGIRQPVEAGGAR
jgi:hypothetical protein